MRVGLYYWLARPLYVFDDISNYNSHNFISNRLKSSFLEKEGFPLKNYIYFNCLNIVRDLNLGSWTVHMYVWKTQQVAIIINRFWLFYFNRLRKCRIEPYCSLSWFIK